MSNFNPSGEMRRCGFNALTHFFFGTQKTQSGWEGPSTTGIRDIDIVMFTAQVIEQMTSPSKVLTSRDVTRDTDRTGLQYETMLLIIRSFANYDMKYNKGTEWNTEMSCGEGATMFDICQGNNRYAVFNSANRTRSRKIKSEVVFTLSGDHWTIEYNDAIQNQLSIRREFFVNLLFMCINAFKTHTDESAYTLYCVGRELALYSTATRGAANIPSYIAGIYNYVAKKRLEWDINITEVTQFIVNYSMLRSAIDLNINRGLAYSITEKYLVLMDRDFINGNFLNLNTNLDFITTDYTNFFSHSPTHNALFYQNVSKSPLTDFAVIIYKRVAGIKTLLEKNGLLKIDDTPKGSVRGNQWFANRENLLLVNRVCDTKALSVASLELYNKDYSNFDNCLEDYLIGFANVDTSNFTTVALGVTSSRQTGNELGRLNHLKFIILVAMRILYINGYRDDQDIIAGTFGEDKSPLDMTDDKFIEYFRKFASMNVPEQSPGGVPYDGMDRLIETLCIFGVFELAKVLIPLSTKPTKFKVSIKRILMSERIEGLNYRINTVYNLIMDIMNNDITVEI